MSADSWAAAALLALASFLPAGDAAAAEQVPRVTFDDGRRFHVDPPASARELRTGSPSIRAFVFEDALLNCHMDPKLLAAQLSAALDPGSTTRGALDDLVGEGADRARLPRLTILVDDFGDRRKVFTSFFVRKPGGARESVIGLDCHPRSRAYWPASLAHELTHAVLADRDVESWLDEGLAQLVEQASGGQQPEAAMHALAEARRLPSLLETARPLGSSKSYALSYLFAKYVFARWGGWSTLRAMAGIGRTAPACARLGSNLARLTCRASRSLRRSNLDPDLAGKMTPRGLLRFFYVALTLNDPSFAPYSIPGWDGFDQRQFDDPGEELRPGQIHLPASDPDEPGESDDTEAYRIHSLGTHFVIEPQAVALRNRRPDPGFWLVIRFE